MTAHDPALRLVAMANQIATFFNTQRGCAPQEIADHLRRFWEPRMREAILTHLDTGGAGLTPPVREALGLLRVPASEGK